MVTDLAADRKLAADRAKRYRARKRGEPVPLRRAGLPPRSFTSPSFEGPWTEIGDVTTGQWSGADGSYYIRHDRGKKSELFYVRSGRGYRSPSGGDPRALGWDLGGLGFMVDGVEISADFLRQLVLDAPGKDAPARLTYYRMGDDLYFVVDRRPAP